MKSRLAFMVLHPLRSLSSRRAWIEITYTQERNYITWQSLSSRRAWIEIFINNQSTPHVVVALLTEGVD